MAGPHTHPHRFSEVHGCLFLLMPGCLLSRQSGKRGQTGGMTRYLQETREHTHPDLSIPTPEQNVGYSMKFGLMGTGRAVGEYRTETQAKTQKAPNSHPFTYTVDGGLSEA